MKNILRNIKLKELNGDFNLFSEEEKFFLSFFTGLTERPLHQKSDVIELSVCTKVSETLYFLFYPSTYQVWCNPHYVKNRLMRKYGFHKNQIDDFMSETIEKITGFKNIKIKYDGI